MEEKKLIKIDRMRKHVWTMLDAHKHTSSSIETESYVIRQEVKKEIYSS